MHRKILHSIGRMLSQLEHGNENDRKVYHSTEFGLDKIEKGLKLYMRARKIQKGFKALGESFR